MSGFFPFQPLRIDFRGVTEDAYTYQGPGEYVRPVRPDDEDMALPEFNEPLHYVRIVLGNDSSEHIFPESSLKAARHKDLGGLLDRAQDMVEQLEPMLAYLESELRGEGEELSYIPTESQQAYREQFQELRDTLLRIARR